MIALLLSFLTDGRSPFLLQTSAKTTLLRKGVQSKHPQQRVHLFIVYWKQMLFVTGSRLAMRRHRKMRSAPQLPFVGPRVLALPLKCKEPPSGETSRNPETCTRCPSPPSSLGLVAPLTQTSLPSRSSWRHMSTAATYAYTSGCSNGDLVNAIRQRQAAIIAAFLVNARRERKKSTNKGTNEGLSASSHSWSSTFFIPRSSPPPLWRSDTWIDITTYESERPPLTSSSAANDVNNYTRYTRFFGKPLFAAAKRVGHDDDKMWSVGMPSPRPLSMRFSNFSSAGLATSGPGRQPQTTNRKKTTSCLLPQTSDDAVADTKSEHQKSEKNSGMGLPRKVSVISRGGTKDEARADLMNRAQSHTSLHAVRSEPLLDNNTNGRSTCTSSVKWRGTKVQYRESSSSCWSSAGLAQREQSRSQSSDEHVAEQQRRTLRLLYRRCLKVISAMSPAQQTYALIMEDLGSLVRPSLRSALPHLKLSSSPPVILRFIFKFNLPTDTDKMRLWCTQAAFTFLKRAEAGDVDRKLLSGWTAITSPSFTALDAAVLVAYIHRFYNPLLDPHHLIPPGKGEQIVLLSREEGRLSSAKGGGASSEHPEGVANALDSSKMKSREHFKEDCSRKEAGGHPPSDGTWCSRQPAANDEGHQRNTTNGGSSSLSALSSESREAPLSELLERVEKRQAAKRDREDKKQFPHKHHPSLDAFSEPILVKLDALLERCRSSLPANERARPERHARLIAQTVLDVLRWESSLLAFHGVGGGCSTASLNAIDEVLLRRQSSHRLLAVIVAHILTSLGVRAVALCNDELPLVAMYSRHRKDKLQCCVDVVNTAILGPEETRTALAGLKINMSTTALGLRLLQNSESVVAQAASFLSAMKRDSRLSPAELHAYDKAARFITAVIEEDALRRAMGQPSLGSKAWTSESERTR